MPEHEKRLRVWSYAEASRAVRYVRVILRELREGFVRMWHLYGLIKKGNEGYDAELLALKSNGIDALEELAVIGVLPYERATRGIALFPFVVEDSSTPRRAYFVFKDSRDMIDSFILNDELCEHNDLIGNERPIPEDWKKPGVVPTLEENRT